MLRSVHVLLFWLVADSLIGARATEDDCSDGQLVCETGCLNGATQACVANLTQTQCLAQSDHTWSSQCNCDCRRIVCDVGCYDSEDERCHGGLTEMQCAEIYGHVEWSARCNCRLQGSDVPLDNSTYMDHGGQVNLYFSIPAFIVLFRESLEVVIVLVVIIQFLTKTRDQGLITDEMFYRFRREVYLGAGLGFACCLVMGVGFLVLASLAYKLFEGDSRLWFEGLMMLITCLVLTFLALNFYKMVHTMRGHERKMKKKVEAVLEASKSAETQGIRASFDRRHAFLVFSFSVGLREGLESILFLVGVVSDVEDLSSLPLPIITALILARLVGCCFFQGTKKLNVGWFMRGSAFLLLFIAAGFFSGSVHKFQELDLFGQWSPRRERAWHNREVFDARECCNDKTNRPFVLLRALFGWQDQPTPVEFFAYGIFWVLSAVIGTVLVKRAKRQLEELIVKWQKMEEEEEAEAQKTKMEGGALPEVIGEQPAEEQKPATEQQPDSEPTPVQVTL